MIPANSLRADAKWTGLCLQGVQQLKECLRIDDIFSIRRGLATGANNFFILNERQVAEYGLPLQFLKPILPSPRYLQSDEISSDAVGNPMIEQRLFLLNCNLPASQLKNEYPKLWEYLETGIPEISERYLCRGRDPWYSQEQRLSAPLLCTYMGRGDTKSGRPFRFILNHSKAIAANVYLMLYPKPVLSRALQQQPELLQQIWKGLNALPNSALIDEGRVYGGGLWKMEPSELANVPLDNVAAGISDIPAISQPSQLLFGFS